MVTFVPGFLASEVAAWGRRETEERNRLRVQFPNDTDKARDGIEAWRRKNPEPPATLGDVADHIDHIRKTAGVDHVGIGGDFDGISSVPMGLENVSKYPALTVELLKRGYSDSNVKKILGLNVLRVMRAAEEVATRLQRDRGPSTAIIEQLDKAPATPSPTR